MSKHSLESRASNFLVLWPCTDPKSFVRWGPTLTTFFSLMREYHYLRAIIGPPAKRHLNGVPLAGRCPNMECWIDSCVILRGYGPVLLRNPIFLQFSRGGGGSGPPVPPSGSAHDGATIDDEVRESGSTSIAIIIILKHERLSM